jgi:Tfp pilus assembly PilM family ATPase
MARLLALEWDAKEARVAVAHARGKEVVVEQAFVVPLPEREGGGGEAEIGAAIGKALAEHGLSRMEVLIAVGRANIELRFLTTPPAPDDELPELVRFQALRQFTTLGDDWPLDFVPLGPNADGGQNVLAAAIAPDLVEQLRKVAAAANLTISRLVLRPFAAASLLREKHADGKCRMNVDLLRDEADMTVLLGPQVIFPRTVRLPAVTEPEVLARALLAEGRRTMIAAQNQLGGRKVEEVVIFGDGQHHSSLKQLLENELSLSVKLVDPFESVEWEGGARARKPEYPGTFAPLLGILRDAAAETRPEIDFLQPRRKPEPPNRRRTYLIAGGAMAALVLLAFGWMQLSLWSLDSQIAQKKKDSAKQKQLADKSLKPIEQAEKLERFTAGDVTWLDELALLSQRMPKAEATTVKEMHWRMDTKKGGGRTTLKGLADKPATITEIERAMRIEGHAALGTGATEDDQAARPLVWAYTEDISVRPESEGAVARPVLPAVKAPAAKAPAASPAPAKSSKSSSSSSKRGGSR